MASLVSLLALLALLPVTQGTIRCYCNSADCAAANYMCTSARGKCFSQFGYATDAARRDSHGCVEQLGEEDACHAHGDLIKARSPPSPWPVLMCCSEQMCNYIDTLDVDIYVNTDNETDDSVVAQHGPLQRRRDVWFEAAVIIVPILGVLILIILVLLAVRMLRSDTRLQSHVTKTQLYEAYPTTIDGGGGGGGIPAYYPQYGLCAHNEAQTVCPSGGGAMATYEKISDCSSDYSSPHNSLIVESKHGPGTIV